MNPKISIVVPVYGVEKYIAKCVETIKNQTFKDFEVLIVNDETKDSSIEIAKKISNDDDRFIYLQKENGGVGKVRNFGLKYAKGEYITFIDPDDYIELDYLEKLLKPTQKHDVDIVVCNFNQVYTKITIPFIHKVAYDKLLNSKDFFDAYMIGVDFAPAPWNKIYKRALFDNVSYLENISFDDFATTYKIIYESKNIFFINENLYNYMQYDNGSVMRSYSRKSINSRQIILEDIKAFLQNKEIYEQHKQAYKTSYLYNYIFSNFVTIAKYCPKQNYNEEIKYFKNTIDKSMFTFNNIFGLYKESKKAFLTLLFAKISPSLVYLLATLDKARKI